MLNVRLIAAGPVETTFNRETFEATYGTRQATLSGLFIREPLAMVGGA